MKPCAHGPPILNLYDNVIHYTSFSKNTQYSLPLPLLLHLHQLPLVGLHVVAYDIDIAVVGFELEVAVSLSVPAVKVGLYLKHPSSDAKGSRPLVGLVARVGLDRYGYHALIIARVDIIGPWRAGTKNQSINPMEKTYEQRLENILKPQYPLQVIFVYLIGRVAVTLKNISKVKGPARGYI